MKITSVGAMALAILAAGLFALPALAEESEAEIAKKTNNPVADLISLPLKLDYDRNIGPAEQGDKYQLTVQPVIPVSISTDWNLISRSLIPLIEQHDVAPGSGTQSGLGDITQQFYFSPKAPTADGWIWGVGPQILMRTGTDGLTAHKWGLGPDAVVLKQEHGWTYGVLTNQMWSVSGSSQANDISATYVQPFLSYTTPHYTTFGINTESTYDWKTSQWSVPINLTVTQLLKIGDQLLTIQGGVRYWAESPDGVGPEGWGFRLQVVFLFPK